MSGLCRSRYRGTASGSVKETPGEPEDDRAGSGMYPDPGYQEVCRVRAGAENEEGCYEKTSLQRTAFCDPEKVQAQYDELEVNYTNLKTATAISLNGSDVKETKLRLSKLVREVDKCIALLNE